MKTVRLEEVAEVIAGQSPSGDSFNKEGNGTPFYQGKKNYGEKYLNAPTVWTRKVTKLAYKNDIILSVRAPVGALNISTQEVCIGRGLAAIRVKKTVLNNYLYYFLMATADKLNGTVGAIFNSINKKQIEDIIIPLPSLTEQQRIVANLDVAFAEIDKAIQLTEKKIIHTEQFNTKALTSIYFDRKNKSLKTLKEIVSIKGGKRLPKGKKLTTENTGYPYIRVSDFNDNGTINLKSVKFIEADVRKQIERYTISSKDVYVSIAGTIGKTGIVPEILENANLTENAVKLVPHESVDKEFLYFFTKTTSFKKQAINQTRTAAQPKLALERLGKVEIPLFDLKKQIKIVSEAKNIILWMKLTKENCYNKIEHLKKLKVAILKQKLKPKKAA